MTWLQEPFMGVPGILPLEGKDVTFTKANETAANLATELRPRRPWFS
jgi:hypothetical protein